MARQTLLELKGMPDALGRASMPKRSKSKSVPYEAPWMLLYLKKTFKGFTGCWAPGLLCTGLLLHQVANLPLCGISYDPARFPRYLPEAYCLCRGCLTGLSGEEDLRFRSAPVYSPAVVLRRTAACVGGRSVYAEHYVTVPVGCTCVPEPDQDADRAGPSVDKPGARLLLAPGDGLARP